MFRCTARIPISVFEDLTCNAHEARTTISIFMVFSSDLSRVQLFLVDSKTLAPVVKYYEFIQGYSHCGVL